MVSCFSKDSRLKKPSEFRAVYHHNQVRVKGRYFLVLAFFRLDQIDHKLFLDKDNMACPHTSKNRLGVVVSKKVSKLAVERNKIKRIVRESYRLYNFTVADYDFIVMANSQAKVQPNQVLNSELSYLWRKINKRCKSYLLG